MIAQLAVPFMCFTIGYAIHENGICFRKNVFGKKYHDGTIKRYDQFCCDFYEERHGECVACKEGYESKGGKPCRLCSSNTFGKFCEQNCDCQIYQWCHHVNGCVSTSKPRNNTTDSGSTKIWTTGTIPENSSTDRLNDVPSDVPIYLSLGIGSIVINIVLCTMCAICYKRTRHTNDIISIENAAMGQMGDEIILEHAYDEIDENAVTGDQVAVINNYDTSDVSSSYGASIEDVTEDGYIMPYQQIVHYPEAFYKNLPQNSEIAQCPTTSGIYFENYENTIIFR